MSGECEYFAQPIRRKPNHYNGWCIFFSLLHMLSLSVLYLQECILKRSCKYFDASFIQNNICFGGTWCIIFPAVWLKQCFVVSSKALFIQIKHYASKKSTLSKHLFFVCSYFWNKGKKNKRRENMAVIFVSNHVWSHFITCSNVKAIPARRTSCETGY